MASLSAPPAQDAPGALLSLKGVGKAYGNTRANKEIDFSIAQGEVVGLVGANGAGKSTLMRIVCGVTEPTEGELSIEGVRTDAVAFTPRSAREHGIRIVWQELSLSPNLTVAENFYVEQPQFAPLSPWWLRSYRRLADQSIERIFPGARIDTGSLVADLSIAERQMVEIARAAADPRLKLLILDEPTSSLGAGRSGQLRRFVAERAAEGVAVIFISHKLTEVLSVSSRVVAMRNGRIVWERPATQTTIADLVEAMGGANAVEAGMRAAQSDSAGELRPVRVRIGGELTAALGRQIELRAGDIVGIAGLEGNGQKDLLQAVFGKNAAGGVTTSGQVRYVSGDRQREGVFPLWSVLDNISIGRIARMKNLRLVKDAEERPRASRLAGQLALDDSRLDSGILDLSGGNQQKTLVARALTDDVEILVLDDPTRGVDIGAKRDFYRLVREIAGAGRLAIWHSTEDVEFLECDRVLVFSKGRLVAQLTGEDISEDKIVAASFIQPNDSDETTAASRYRGIGATVLKPIPFVSLALVFGAMAWLNPLVASSFGLELLLTPAVTLVLLALAQMFIIGGSEIDLGVGLFAGFINVVSATLLVMSPWLGAMALAGGMAGYALMGLLIQWRAIPAIVVTLGASFIWMGLGQSILPSPGGASPPWVSDLFTWAIPGLPTPLVIILIAAALAAAIDRSPTGTILRAFGSSPMALARGGWSPVRFAITRYVIACLFAMAAGLYVTATNNAADINAGASFTLLSVAAVVIGGCQLLGGYIAPLGVVAGAVTLSLIGALLAAFGVSTDYNAAVQGALLIVILGLQAAMIGKRRHG